MQDLLCHRSAVEAASRRQRTLLITERRQPPSLSAVKERTDLTNVIGPQPLNVTLTWMTAMTAVDKFPNALPNPQRISCLIRSLAAGARKDE